MELENQVNSRELGKELLSLGVKRRSYFYWRADNIITESDVWDIGENFLGVWDKVIPAYTVSELGEMLPGALFTMCPPYYLSYRKADNAHHKHIIYYENTIASKWSPHRVIGEYRDENEANVRAKLLIYLLENKLVSLDEINKQNEL